MNRFRFFLLRKEWSLRLALAFGVACIAVGAGCTSSTVYVPATVTPTAPAATATPPPLPSTSPFGASNSVNVQATSAAQTISGPSVSGFQGNLTAPLASPSPGTQVTVTIGSTPPPGFPPLGHERAVQAVSRVALDTTIETVLYICYTANQQVTESGNPVFAITLPNGYTPTGLIYYLAIFLNNAWAFGYAGPGSISGNVVTLTGAWPLTFGANQQQCFSLYGQASSAPAPTPPPQPTPTAAATGAAAIGIQ
jgi:hypothetical protein